MTRLWHVKGEHECGKISLLAHHPSLVHTTIKNMCGRGRLVEHAIEPNNNMKSITVSPIPPHDTGRE